MKSASKNAPFLELLTTLIIGLVGCGFIFTLHEILKRLTLDIEHGGNPLLIMLL